MPTQTCINCNLTFSFSEDDIKEDCDLLYDGETDWVYWDSVECPECRHWNRID